MTTCMTRAVHAVDYVAQKVVGQGPWPRLFLQFKGDGVRLAGADPHGQVPVAVRVQQHDQALLRHQTDANAVNDDFNHEGCPSLVPPARAGLHTDYTRMWRGGNGFDDFGPANPATGPALAARRDEKQLADVEAVGVEQVVGVDQVLRAEAIGQGDVVKRIATADAVKPEAPVADW